MAWQVHELDRVVERLDLVFRDTGDILALLALHPDHEAEEAQAARDVAADSDPKKVLSLHTTRHTVRTTSANDR